MADDPKCDPYGLDAVFERIVAQFCATSTKFWGKVAPGLDPEAITDPTARLIIRACGTIFRETGRGPTSYAIVMQRLRSWREQGKVPDKDLQPAKIALADAEEDLVDFDEQAILLELLPVLRRRMEKNALKRGYDTYSKKGDLAPVSLMLDKAQRLGAADTSTGLQLGSYLFDAELKVSDIKRLSTGIIELDASLDDGMKRANFGVVMGSTGAGKSLFMSHIAAEAAAMGIGVAYATLEINEEDICARILGNLVDMPVSDLTRFKASQDEAKRRVQLLERDGLLGFAVVKYFTPDVTTVDDIFEWITAEEDAHRQKIEVVLIDSGNHLTDAGKKTRWEQQDGVSAKLRDRAHKDNIWIWTGAQADAEGMNTKKTKRLEAHNAAYSKGIPRNCDLLITLNPRDEGIMYHVAKNRLGKGGDDVGPIPHQWEFGRMCGVIRQGWPKDWSE